MSGRPRLIPPEGILSIWLCLSGSLTLPRSSRHSSMTCWEIWSISSYMSTWMTYWFFLLLSRNMFNTSDRVLQRLLENGLFVKAEKCAFHAQSVPFLGFIVSPEGVRMDPDRVKAVVNWPTPDSRKALLRFLGFANFYRRFIRNFSQLAAPLTALTSTKMTFRWSNAAEAAFTKLRGRFVSAPILRGPWSHTSVRGGGRRVRGGW